MDRRHEGVERSSVPFMSNSIAAVGRFRCLRHGNARRRRRGSLHRAPSAAGLTAGCVRLWLYQRQAAHRDQPGVVLVSASPRRDGHAHHGYVSRSDRGLSCDASVTASASSKRRCVRRTRCARRTPHPAYRSPVCLSVDRTRRERRQKAFCVPKASPSSFWVPIQRGQRWSTTGGARRRRRRSESPRHAGRSRRHHGVQRADVADAVPFGIRHVDAAPCRWSTGSRAGSTE